MRCFYFNYITLISCYLTKYPRNDIYIDSIVTNNIEREYSNGSDKSIGLLIDCSSFLVVIENKIYASLYNDLDLYFEMAKNYLKDVDNIDISILKIVWSLNEVNDIKQKDVINITYDELFLMLERDKDRYRQDNKYQLLADEFIENIKRRKGTMAINEKWIEFASNNADDVNNFIDIYNRDCHERLSLCKKLAKAVKEQDESLNVGTYSGSNDPYYSVYLNIKLDDGTPLCIETYIMKKPSKKEYEDYDKIYMALWARDRRSFDYLKRYADLLDAKDAKAHKTDGWKEQFILQIIPINSIDINKVSYDIVEYAHKIKG